MQVYGFLVLAVVIGCVGTLIGAGGGFVLAPILLLLHPTLRPDQLAAVTLAVVFVNASVGSFSYWLRGMVDVRSACRFALAAIPGALLGVAANRVLPREAFAAGLGLLLIVGGLLILLRPADRADEPAPEPDARSLADPLGPSIPHPRGRGLVIAAAVGFVSSLLGIGGGILHVPAMVRFLRFPVHHATATSHLVLALTTAVAVGVHFAADSYAGHWQETSWLATGVVLGAPLGAALAPRLHGRIILGTLAVALIAVGARTLVAAG